MDGDFRVAAWLVRPRLNTVSKNGQTVRLEPKVMEVLACLAEHAGDVVEKERLIQTVCNGTFVTDDVLTRAISELRGVFGDDPRQPQFIETIPKRGYRLIAPVEPVGAGLAPPWASVSRRMPLRKRRFATLAGAATLGIGALLVALNVAGLRDRMFSRPKPPAGKIMLVVLPFENLSGDPKEEYFSDGMTEEMTAQLGQLSPQHLGVIGRASAMTYKGRKKTIDEIGKELRVHYVLEGSARHAGGRVRITAQLIEVGDQTHVWAQTYDRDLRDILALQSEVAQAITDQIKIKLTPLEQTRLASARPVNPESYQAYLKGSYHLDRWTVEETRRARQRFQEAIGKDPNYAPAYAGLARSYTLIPGAWLTSVNESYGKARGLAEKALGLDPTLAEAHLCLAEIKDEYDWDWSGAETEFKRAIDLNPNFAGAHVRYSALLSILDRHKEALTEAQRAQHLDPLSPWANTQVGYVFYWAREYDQAIAQFRTTLDLDPGYARAYFGLGRAYLGKGMHEEAIQALRKGGSLYSGSHTPDGLLGYAYAMAGERNEALRMANELKRLWKQRDPDAGYELARAYAGLGDRVRALEWLERAYQEHYPSVRVVRIDPQFDGLRSDPRFQDLLRRMNFPP